MDAPRPSRHAAQRDALLLGTLIAVWLLPWVSLTLATLLAGGAPQAGPLSFLSPAHLLTAFHAMRGIAPWVLVSPQRSVVPRAFWFWISMCALGLLLCGGCTARVVRTASSRRRQLQRTSSWASRRDLRALLKRNAAGGRFVVGRRGSRLVMTEPESSVLVIGPTRTGKTSALVIPNLLEWRGPAVATSTKAELVRLTAGHRQRTGPVYVYDPTGDALDDVCSVTWSPLAGCEDLDHAWRVAAWLCAALQQGGARGDNDWAHWSESGKLLIAPLLYAAARSERTIVEVQSWIHAFDATAPMALLEELLCDGDADSGRALSMLQSIDQRPDRERGTVFSTVMRIFSAFNERAVARSAQTSRFDPHRLLTERGTLYLCTARQAPERVAGLFVGLLMTVVTAAYAMADASPRGRLHPELGLFLDELANVVPIEDLPSLASQGAGRGVVLMSIVQDLSQLRARYGADRSNSVLNNHVCKLVLSGISDPETTDVVTKLAGQAARTDVQINRGAGSEGRTYALREAPLASADALRRLPAGRALMLYRGRPPALLGLRSWYGDRRLRRLSSVPYLRGVDHVVEAAVSASPSRRSRSPADPA